VTKAPARATRFGSSPRVRGTPRHCRQRCRRSRFIPAGAGNTQKSPGRPGFRAVHPRGCGEHSSAPAMISAISGSSPRVRGTRAHPAPSRTPARFIPAGAGNTVSKPRCRRTTPVHPRGCGEHGRSSRCLSRSVGSSPRVRGTRPAGGFPRPGWRFIPAGAGNTGGRSVRFAAQSVHPRGCGEHTLVLQRLDPCVGSSPRVRGTPAGTGGSFFIARFIPAGAGNTPTPIAWRRSGYGSSPRVRGTLISADPASRLCRFIPAGAGNTVFVGPEELEYAVHPRGCGEHALTAYVPETAGGSSPRVRGTPAWVAARSC